MRAQGSVAIVVFALHLGCGDSGASEDGGGGGGGGSVTDDAWLSLVDTRPVEVAVTDAGAVLVLADGSGAPDLGGGVIDVEATYGFAFGYFAADGTTSASMEASYRSSVVAGQSETALLASWKAGVSIGAELWNIGADGSVTARYPAAGDPEIFDAAATQAAGRTVIAGRTAGSTTSADPLVRAYDAQGAPVFTAQFPVQDSANLTTTEITGVGLAPNGDVIVVGHSSFDIDLGDAGYLNVGEGSFDEENTDVFVLRLSPDGTVLAAEVMHSNGIGRATTVDFDAATGDVLIAGWFDSSTTFGSLSLSDLQGGAFVLRLTPDLAPRYLVQPETEAAVLELGYYLNVTARVRNDGVVVSVADRSASTNGVTEMFELDAAGAPVRTESFAGVTIADIAVMRGGDLALVGWLDESAAAPWPVTRGTGRGFVARQAW